MSYISLHNYTDKQILSPIKLLLWILVLLSNLLFTPVIADTTISPSDSIRFTGGDNLTGIEKLYHEIMIKNELYDGKGAYKLSYDGGKGGPSFGGNQMNIGVNEEARKILFDIIINAKGKISDFNLNDIDIANIKKKLITINKSKQKSLSNDLKGSAEKVFGIRQTMEINKILKSDYGRKRLDEIYVLYIKEKAKKIDRVISNIKLAAPKEFYSTNQGKGLLFDYEIQYGIIESGPKAKLVNFLNTGETTTYTGKKLKFTSE